MSKQNALRLPYGQRVIVTSEINNWSLPVGARGVIVEGEHAGDFGKLSADDYFWRNWQEQFVLFDAGTNRTPLQVSRAHMDPIDESQP